MSQSNLQRHKIALSSTITSNHCHGSLGAQHIFGIFLLVLSEKIVTVGAAEGKNLNEMKGVRVTKSNEVS